MDLIYRQELARRLATSAPEQYSGLVAHIISTAPTIEVEKHGRWKPFDLTWGRSLYVCTSCGAYMEVPTEMGTPIYDYCPNCGAKMDEVEE